jgi:ankyrin repeat protein
VGTTSEYLLLIVLLCFASKGRCLAAANALLKTGAKIDAKGKDGYTSLMLAEYLKHPAVVKILTKYCGGVDTTLA